MENGNSLRNQLLPKLKFTPEFNFLEDPKIFELQQLMDKILSSETNPEEKQELLTELETKWEMLQKQYIAESPKNASNIKNFLLFVSHNLRLISLGGMSSGRSKISVFINEKSAELTPYFNRFLLPEE